MKRAPSNPRTEVLRLLGARVPSVRLLLRATGFRGTRRLRGLRSGGTHPHFGLGVGPGSVCSGSPDLPLPTEASGPSSGIAAAGFPSAAPPGPCDHRSPSSLSGRRRGSSRPFAPHAGAPAREERRSPDKTRTRQDSRDRTGRRRSQRGVYAGTARASGRSRRAVSRPPNATRGSRRIDVVQEHRPGRRISAGPTARAAAPVPPWLWSRARVG